MAAQYTGMCAHCGRVVRSQTRPSAVWCCLECAHDTEGTRGDLAYQLRDARARRQWLAAGAAQQQGEHANASV